MSMNTDIPLRGAGYCLNQISFKETINTKYYELYGWNAKRRGTCR